MTYSSSLVNNFGPLVLDTSVLINIHASTFGQCVLSTLPNDILVPDIVISEFGHQNRNTSSEKKFVEDLAADGEIKFVSMKDHENDIYASLVSGNSSLGDGEAATIAIAASRSCLPVIDEHKGRQKANVHCSDNSPVWSLELVHHPQVVNTLGPADSVKALYLALRDGRMRIHKDHCDYVVELIGLEQALECKSLPGYKTRQQKWLKNRAHSN